MLQNVYSVNWFKASIKLRFQDQFEQLWYSNIQTSPKGLVYKLYNEKLIFEKYFEILSDKDYITLCRFRTLNHALPIESGKWQNIERNDRKCETCGSLGDEYHYLFECSELTDERKLFLPRYCLNRPNILKLCSLFTTVKISTLKNLCKFIRCILEKTSPPG